MFDLYGRGWQMLEGGLVTVQLCLTVLPFMIIIGLLGASAKLSRYRSLRLIGESYTVLIRGIPELLVILLIYFGGTIAVQSLAEIISGEETRVDIPAFWSGGCGLWPLSKGPSHQKFSVPPCSRSLLVRSRLQRRAA